MFSLASSKLRRHKKKNKQSHNNERTTTNNHQPEFQLKVRRGNESEIQEVPIWIPLSIMAEGSAIAYGASIHSAQIASSVIIGHGNVVANRYHHTQRGSLSRKADAFGEITVAAKISALSLLRSGESIQSSKAVEDAVLGWGGFLLAYVYANKLITLDGIAEEGSTTPGGNDDEHNPLWQASLDAVSRNDDYSNMTIPSGHSQPQNTTSKNKPIVDYYKTNVGRVPIIGNDIYLVSQKGVQKGESKIIPLQQEEEEDVSAGGRVSLTDRISSALFNDGQLVKDVLSWEDKNEDVSSTNKNRNAMIDVASTDSSNGDDGQEQYINGGILSPPTTSANIKNNKPTRKIGSKHLSKKEMIGISAMALLLILAVGIGLTIRNLLLNRASSLNQSNDNWKWFEEACDGDGGYIDIGSYYSTKSSKSTTRPPSTSKSSKSPTRSPSPSIYTESSSKSSKSTRSPSFSKSSKSMSALRHLALSRSDDEEEELLPTLPMLTRRHIVKDEMINSDKAYVETDEEFTGRGGLRRRHHRDLHSSHDNCECDDDESKSDELIRHLLLPEAESEAVEYEVGEERSDLSEASAYTLLPEAETEYDIGGGKRHLAGKCKCTSKTTSSNSTTYGSKSSKNSTDSSTDWYDYSSKSNKNSTDYSYNYASKSNKADTALPDYDDVSDRKTKCSKSSYTKSSKSSSTKSSKSKSKSSKSALPSAQPSTSSQPSTVPSYQPSNNPSESSQPSEQPSSQPSAIPSYEPSIGYRPTHNTLPSPTKDEASSDLVPASGDCPSDFTCLRNREWEDQDPTQFNMDISLEVKDSVVANAFQLAREKIMQVVTGDLDPRDSAGYSTAGKDNKCGNGTYPSTIDDSFICGIEGDIDGEGTSLGNILGMAGPRYVRRESSTTITAQMTFDTVDIPNMISNGSLEDVIRHEMLHAMGFGTIWSDPLNLVTVNSPTSFIFNGDNVRQVWQTDWSCDGEPPVQEVTGGHWQESCFVNELMTPNISPSGEANPFSKLTVAALKDQGYEVNYDAANPDYDGSYTTCCSGSNILPASKPTKPQLSDAGKAYATYYGLRILKSNELPIEEIQSITSNNEDVEYVGDKFITILMEEGGNIYDVHVTNTDRVLI